MNQANENYENIKKKSFTYDLLCMTKCVKKETLPNN